MNRDRFLSRLLGGGALLALASFALVAAAALGKSGTSDAGFHALGPAGFKIDGTTSELGLADDGTTVTITVPLAKVKTRLELCDKHYKELLEVDKYPTATLKVPRASLKLGEGDVKGSLTLHGQTKDVNVHYEAKKSGDTYDVKGRSRLNINNFGMKTPTYLGVAVKPDVDIYANFQAKDS